MNANWEPWLSSLDAPHLVENNKKKKAFVTSRGYILFWNTFRDRFRNESWVLDLYSKYFLFCVKKGPLIRDVVQSIVNETWSF